MTANACLGILILITLLVFGVFKHNVKAIKKPFEKIHFTCFCINLTSRSDRYARFMAQYNKSDLSHFPIQRLSAINGKKLYEYRGVEGLLTDQAIEELSDQHVNGGRSGHHELTPGAIGCYLSHVFSWEHILQKDHEKEEETDTHYLVFEDDCNVPPTLNTQITECISGLNELDSDWDILLLGAIVLKGRKTRNALLSKVSRFVLLHCYVIRPKAIYKIVESNTLFPLGQQIDFQLSDLASTGAIRVYNGMGRKIRQGGFVTDIQTALINPSSLTRSGRDPPSFKDLDNDTRGVVVMPPVVTIT